MIAARQDILTLGYPHSGYEFSLLLGTVALSLCFTGPGRLSVDHLASLK